MEIKIFFFFFFFFYKSTCMFFHHTQWSFFGYIKSCIYTKQIISAIVCDQNLNGESIWRLVRAKYAPLPLFMATFFQISLAVLRI